QLQELFPVLIAEDQGFGGDAVADGVLRRDRAAMGGLRTAGFGAVEAGGFGFGQFHLLCSLSTVKSKKAGREAGLPTWGSAPHWKSVLTFGLNIPFGCHVRSAWPLYVDDIIR